jgi:hypothetical protein
MRIAIERTIAAPPAVVFGIYTDPARLSEWQPGVKGVIEQRGRLDEPGTTYLLDQPGPRLRIEVLRVDAPRLHEQLESFRWYGWIGTARFDPLPDGATRFSYAYAPSGRLRWLWLPLIALSAVLFGRAEFNRLKEVAERTALKGGGETR